MPLTTKRALPRTNDPTTPVRGRTQRCSRHVVLRGQRHAKKQEKPLMSPTFRVRCRKKKKEEKKRSYDDVKWRFRFLSKRPSVSPWGRACSSSSTGVPEAALPGNRRQPTRDSKTTVHFALQQQDNCAPSMSRPDLNRVSSIGYAVPQSLQELLTGLHATYLSASTPL